MLNIFLGYGCNFKCAYCLQQPEAMKGVAQREYPVEPFIAKVVPLMKERGITEVSYWGGEPLIYWKQVKAIQEGLIEAGIKLDFTRITTNGSLLTDEHVALMNDWGTHNVISMHGKFGHPNWDMVTKLDTRVLSFLFTHQQLTIDPFFETVDRLEQWAGTHFYTFMHWVRSTDGTPADMWMTHDDLDVHVPHLWELAHRRLNGDPRATQIFNGHLMKWDEQLQAKQAPAMCHGAHHISVDLHGDRYACHHSVNPLYRTGNVFTGESLPQEQNMAYRFIKTEECQACPIRYWCRGNCHLSNTHDVDCRLSKEKHKVFTFIKESENAGV